MVALAALIGPAVAIFLVPLYFAFGVVAASLGEFAATRRAGKVLAAVG